MTITLSFSGFPLTSFHLAESLLSGFSWLYILVTVVQKYREMSFIYNYSHFYDSFCNQPVSENVNKLRNNNRTVHVNEQNQKNKTKSSQSN